MHYIIDGRPITNGYNQLLTVYIENMICNCSTYLERTVCPHLIACCLIVNKDIPGVEPIVI